MPQTADGRPVGKLDKSESSRISRGDTSAQKTNGAFSSPGRKSSESPVRVISNKSRCELFNNPFPQFPSFESNITKSASQLLNFDEIAISLSMP